MPLIYYDREVLEAKDAHPAMVPDKKHPCYAMVRSAIDGKSVFAWNKKQAFSMYKWYCEGWPSVSIYTEFGEDVSVYTFKDMIIASHYMIGKKVSSETIKEMWDAVQMEHKILELIGEKEEGK